MTPTTRRHARTLAEAFPQERWPAIEHYRSPLLRRLQWFAGVALAIVIGVSLAVLAVRELAS